MSGKVLIVDDVATNRIVLKVKLATAHYETIQAATGNEALMLAAELVPDLILLDVELPDMDGIEVCRRLRAAPQTRDIPVVMISAFRDRDRRIAALQAGASEILWKPVDELVLLARLRSLLRARENSAELGLRAETCRELGLAEPPAAYVGRATIALLDDRIEEALQLKRRLSAFTPDRLVILDRDAAFAPGARGAPDVFVLQARMGRAGDCLRILSELRSRHATRDAAICLVVGPGDQETAAIALDLGADDLIDAGASPEEMALRLRAQAQRKRDIERLRARVDDGLRMAVTDPLTGLHNRRYALAQLGRLAAQARQADRPLAVMVLDLDRFKEVNDTHGHAAGDAVLVAVSDRLRANLRAGDLLARIGGEEFLLAMPEAPLPAAREAAERLRRVIAETPVALANGQRVTVTASVGLALGDPRDAAAVDLLIDEADAALLASKALGRNQVQIARPAA